MVELGAVAVFVVVLLPRTEVIVTLSSPRQHPPQATRSKQPKGSRPQASAPCLLLPSSRTQVHRPIRRMQHLTLRRKLLKVWTRKMLLRSSTVAHSQNHVEHVRQRRPTPRAMISRHLHPFLGRPTQPPKGLTHPTSLEVSRLSEWYLLRHAKNLAMATCSGIQAGRVAAVSEPAVAEVVMALQSETSRMVIHTAPTFRMISADRLNLAYLLHPDTPVETIISSAIRHQDPAGVVGLAVGPGRTPYPSRATIHASIRSPTAIPTARCRTSTLSCLAFQSTAYRQCLRSCPLRKSNRRTCS